MTEEQPKFSRNPADHLKEHQFKKGESGNPGGKPKGTRDYLTVAWEAMKAIADSKGWTAEEFEQKLLESGLLNSFKDFRFYKEHMERRFGKVVEKSEQKITGSVDGLTINFVNGKSPN